jgi:hypothetical protein
MEKLCQDLRYGVRALLRKRSVMAMAVLTIALGIGANTAIFSLVNAILLKPLPFQAPEQLVEIQTLNLNSGQPVSGASAADFWNWQEQRQAFENIAASSGGDTTLTLEDHSESFPDATVSINFFDTLGIKPLYGCGFTTEEGKTNAPPVLILSHKLWQQKFAGDQSVIGKTIKTARLALGAQKRDIRNLVIGQTMKSVSMDIAIGIGADTPAARSVIWYRCDRPVDLHVSSAGFNRGRFAGLLAAGATGNAC